MKEVIRLLKEILVALEEIKREIYSQGPNA